MIDDMKKPGMGDQAMAAKLQVVKELKKLAMQLMANGIGDDDHGDSGPVGDATVIAKLDTTKLPVDSDDDSSKDEMSTDMSDSSEDQDGPSDEDQSTLIDRMLAKRKMMR